MLVRRTYLDHCHIAAESSATVQLLCLAEEYRDIVRISCLHALADIAAYEECLMEEYPAELRISIWRRPFGVKMVDAYILKFSCLSSSAEGFNENAWCACNAAEVDMVAGFNDFYGLVCRNECDLFTHNYVIEPQR